MEKEIYDLTKYKDMTPKKRFKYLYAISRKKIEIKTLKHKYRYQFTSFEAEDILNIKFASLEDGYQKALKQKIEFKSENHLGNFLAQYTHYIGLRYVRDKMKKLISGDELKKSDHFKKFESDNPSQNALRQEGENRYAKLYWDIYRDLRDVEKPLYLDAMNGKTNIEIATKNNVDKRLIQRLRHKIAKKTYQHSKKVLVKKQKLRE